MTPPTAHPDAPGTIFAFGVFALDMERRELRRSGAPIRVEPRVLDLIAWLVRHRQRVVSREELLAALWPGQHVSDAALAYCVKAARRAVDDRGTEQHTIATVQRRGYRFVADTVELASPSRGAERSIGRRNRWEEPGGGFFIGRDAVMARLLGALSAAAAGRGRIAMLVGEPGIGKTRTAEELARSAALQGVEVLVGRCHEGAGAPPFWPWVQIVRTWAGAREGGGSVEPSPAGRSALPSELAVLLGPAERAAPRTDAARFRLFDAVALFLTRAAEAHPLLIVLDDLHWSDKASLLLLQFVSHELHRAGILVVGTFRDSDVAPGHPLLDCTAELARSEGFDRIELEGLTATDVGRFIEASTGEPTPLATASRVHEQTGGNPFFVAETVRHLVARGRSAGAATGTGAPIGGGARDVVRRRVDALSADARALLRVASVFGRDVDLDLLLRASPLGRGAAGRTAILRAVAECVRAHLLEPRAAGTPVGEPGAPAAAGSGGGAYRFAHALVVEAIYDMLDAAERARLHARAGAALVAGHRADLGPHLGAIAHHFARAAVAGEGKRALEFAIRAGDRAAAMVAWEEAASHYASALSLIERADPARVGRGDRRASRTEPGEGRADDRTVVRHGPAAPRQPDVDSLLFALGENLWKSGEFDRARATYLRAAQRARESGSATQFARAALGFGGEFRGFEVGKVDHDLIELLEQALRGLPRRPGALRARATARLAVALYEVPGSLERRQELSQEAVRLAAGSRDAGAELAALYSRHWAIWGPDTLRDRLATARAMRRLAERVGDGEAALHARRFHLIDSLEVGDLDAVDADLAACSRLAEEQRQPYYLWYAAQFRAMRALLAGDLAGSERGAGEALEAGRRARSRNVEQTWGSQILWVRREQGRSAEVEPALRALVTNFPGIAAWRCALCLLLAELGHVAETRAHLEVLAERGFGGVPRDAFWMAAMCVLADAVAEIGAANHAAVLYPQLLPYRGRIVESTLGAACLGALDRPLGRLAALLGRSDLAAAHFEQATAAESRLGAPLLLARTRRHALECLRGVERPRPPTAELAPRKRARPHGGTAPPADDPRSLRRGSATRRPLSRTR